MAKYDKLLGQVQQHLDDDEEIALSVFGGYETKMFGKDTVRNGIFVATNKRLVFFAKKLTGFDLEAFPYSNISSIEMGKNLMGYHISFFASGNKASMKWIKKDNVPEFVTFVKAHLGKKSEPTQTPDSELDQLKKLAELKKEGIITEAEFSAKKKKILDL